MAEDCLPQVQACAIRVAVLDASGVPRPGAENLYTSSAFTEVTWNPNVKDAAEIEEENACGDLCVSFRGDDSIKWWDWGITLCSADPYLEAIFSGGSVLDMTAELGAGAPSGYAAPPIGVIQSERISVELWAKRVLDGDLDPDFPYAWWAFPKVANLRPGDRTFGSGNQTPEFTGRSLENPNWFDGPLNDWPASSDRSAQWVPATELPEIVCGPQALAAS